MSSVNLITSLFKGSYKSDTIVKSEKKKPTNMIDSCHYTLFVDLVVSRLRLGERTPGYATICRGQESATCRIPAIFQLQNPNCSETPSEIRPSIFHPPPPSDETSLIYRILHECRILQLGISVCLWCFNVRFILATNSPFPTWKNQQTLSAEWRHQRHQLPFDYICFRLNLSL